MRVQHEKQSDGGELILKRDWVRDDHEKNSDGLRLHHEKKSDGARLDH